MQDIDVNALSTQVLWAAFALLALMTVRDLDDAATMGGGVSPC